MEVGTRVFVGTGVLLGIRLGVQTGVADELFLFLCVNVRNTGKRVEVGEAVLVFVAVEVEVDVAVAPVIGRM